jgi:multidrug efflux pump
VNRLIDWSFDHARTILIAFLLILTAAAPPMSRSPRNRRPRSRSRRFYVSVAYEGISPEDAERLLIRPLETQLQSLDGAEA